MQLCIRKTERIYPTDMIGTVETISDKRQKKNTK